MQHLDESGVAERTEPDGPGSVALLPLDPKGTFRRVPFAPHQLVDPVTAAGDVFVLAHLGVPRATDGDAWSLTIGGLVETPLRLDMTALRRRPKRVVEAFHQCAGNPLEPTIATRRVANVRWGGVDLATLIAEAGPRPEATFLWSYGADYGEFAGTHHACYLKDLPIGRLAAGDVLLAYELDGAPLSAEHGFPLRLVVPGFYGTNSVKWLTRIELADRRADGPFTTTFYNDQPDGTPVWSVPVESVIVSPAPGAEVLAGAAIEVRGWSWADAGVDRVDVSIDGGVSWSSARIRERTDRGWQGFDWECRAPIAPGAMSIAARATSRDGHVQPFANARNHTHSVSIDIIGADGQKELAL